MGKGGALLLVCRLGARRARHCATNHGRRQGFCGRPPRRCLRRHSLRRPHGPCQPLRGALTAAACEIRVERLETRRAGDRFVATAAALRGEVGCGWCRCLTSSAIRSQVPWRSGRWQQSRMCSAQSGCCSRHRGVHTQCYTHICNLEMASIIIEP